MGGSIAWSLAPPVAVRAGFARADARLVLAYFWASFLFFAAGIPLGFWQMWTRSPVPAPFANAANYYLSLTAHGVIEGYVLTTLFAMGFGYAVIASALERRIPLPAMAWSAFGLVMGGAAMTALTILGGHASVLYTFYPPLVAPPTFYLGLVLVFVGSWLWVGQMVWSMADWKRTHARAPVPLAMFAMTGAAIIWAWTSVGATVEVLFQLLPLSLGFTDSIDIGLARTLFSWTLHGIVYFWLAPAYVAYYTLLPRAAGGRLYSDTMGRWSFIFLMVFGLPVGLHHLLMDPEQASAFKYIQVIFTAAVTIPTLLTIFTVIASLEIGGRVRAARADGGTGSGGAGSRGAGSLGWIRAAAVASPNAARRRALAADARSGGPRRRHQHELCAQHPGAQHRLHPGALPPDLRRHHGDHVFRHRLRVLAGTYRTGAGDTEARLPAALAVVHRHLPPHVALARDRPGGRAASHGAVRLQRADARRPRAAALCLPVRRSAAGGLHRDVPLGAGAVFLRFRRAVHRRHPLRPGA